MISETVMIAGGAGLACLLVGMMSGAFFSARRMRARVTEIGGEVMRLRKIAEDKLSEDDPDLPELLRNLNTAVEQAYRAVDALENQSELTRRKTEGAKEMITASRHIVMLMEDLGARAPAAGDKARTISAKPLGAPSVKAKPTKQKKEPPVR